MSILLVCLRALFIVVVSSAVLLVAPYAAAAAEPVATVTWSVSPADGAGANDGRSWVELELDPGDTVEDHLVVNNLSASPVTFRVIPADGYFTETGRFNLLPADVPSSGAGTWIRVASVVTVPAREAITLPFTVTVPESATPGDHAAGISVGFLSSGQQAEISVDSRVGFRVMTRVTGELAPSTKVSLSGLYSANINPFAPGSLSVDYTVANTGNTRISATPTIVATGPFGVCTSIPAETIAEMAPGESRRGHVTLPSLWPLFVYELSTETSAEILPEDLSPHEVLTTIDGASVLALPWAQFVTVMLTFAIIAAWTWNARRRRRGLQRQIRAAMEAGRAEEAAARINSSTTEGSPAATSP